MMFWKNRRKIRNLNIVNELIQKVVNNDPQTTKVVLKGVSIPPDLLTTLAMALICNTHVKILYLASLTTPLWPQSALVMASALVQNSSLETVWLEDNQICSIGAASFATVFYANKSIKTFGLRNNLIGNRGKLRQLHMLAYCWPIGLKLFFRCNRSIKYSICTTIKHHHSINSPRR